LFLILCHHPPPAKRVLLGGNVLSDVLFLSEQNAIVDKLCHLPAQTLAGDVVSTEVLPCVNTAQSALLRRGGEPGEVSGHSRQRLGADIESELVAEVKAQHGRARFTDCAVCSGVGRIWSGLRGLWKPGWIRVRLRISISARQSNRSYRTPKVVRVLGLE